MTAKIPIRRCGALEEAAQILAGTPQAPLAGADRKSHLIRTRSRAHIVVMMPPARITKSDQA
jgi:hypothetical protein